MLVGDGARATDRLQIDQNVIMKFISFRRFEMHTKKITQIAVALFGFAFFLAGCAGDGDDNKNQKNSKLLQKIEQAQSEKSRQQPDVDKQTVQKLAESNAAFAVDLYNQLTSDDSSENLFYSPYSISSALAMTYAGSDGETKTQMAETLHFEMPEKKLHPAFNKLNFSLEPGSTDGTKSKDSGNTDKTPFTLNIANALWGRRKASFEQPFLDTLAVNYGAGLNLLDFGEKPDQSRRIINAWVANETNQKIDKLLQEGDITPNTRFVLTNAIYFNADWSHQFDEQKTRSAEFTKRDGSTVQVDMMHQVGSFKYLETDTHQAIELPYAGEETSMVVLLPHEDKTLGDLEISAEAFAEVSENKAVDVQLGLPKFKYRNRFRLAKQLKNLGMPAAFNPDKANFSRISSVADIYITDVIHEAFVKVDEEGTEAAAATAVAGDSAGTPPKKQMTVNRPFVFAIRHQPTNTLLFAGEVLDPTQ